MIAQTKDIKTRDVKNGRLTAEDRLVLRLATMLNQHRCGAKKMKVKHVRKALDLWKLEAATR